MKSGLNLSDSSEGTSPVCRFGEMPVNLASLTPAWMSAIPSMNFSVIPISSNPGGGHSIEGPGVYAERARSAIFPVEQSQRFTRRRGSWSPLPIGIASMSDDSDVYEPGFVIERIDDAMVAHPNSPQICRPL